VTGLGRHAGAGDGRSAGGGTGGLGGALADWLARFNLKRPQLTYLYLLGLAVVIGLGLMLLDGSLRLSMAPGSPASPTRPDTQAAQGVGGDADPGGAASGSTAGAASALGALETAMAADVADILSQVAGAGRVAVRVTLASGPQQVLASDNTVRASRTEETDNQGGTRTITQEDDSQATVVLGYGGAEQVVVLQLCRPEVAGVLVVADGAVDPAVRERLAAAVQVFLGIPAHKVLVLPGNGGGEER